MDKQNKIVSMFNDIAGTYDMANRVLSFGIDTIWRKRACDISFMMYDKSKVEKIIDVACGTGDMIHYWQERAKASNIDIENIVGVDPSVGMMEVAKEKLPEVEFIEAGAAEMPFEDAQADFISISYGIRNVVEREKALGEFYRVLKPGGLLIILEFAKDDKAGIVTTIRDFYMKKVLPIVGGILSSNKEAYTYLPNSIDGFLTQESMKQELENTGFDVSYMKGFSMNISTLFIAKKPNDA